MTAAPRLPIAFDRSGIAARLTTWSSLARTESRLGTIPLVSFVGALGLFLVSVADTFGRLEIPGSQLVFWAGYLCVVAPAGLRLVGLEARRNERLWLLVLLGFGMYAIKLIHSPDSFTLFDEFHHWATLNDITATGHLFVHNNILAASPFYPALEIMSSAIVRAGGSAWDAGVIVIGAGRLVLVLALYLFLERATTSARLAGIATLIYMANPSFLFFDAQFAYESLALPLALFVLFCVARRERGLWSGSLAMTLAIVLGIATVVVTHHVTSILLAVFLIGWASVTALVHALRARRPAVNPATGNEPLNRPGAWDAVDSGGLIGPALICLTATVAWMLYVASVTVGYLAPAFAGALGQVVNLIQGEDSGRELFRGSTGVSAPLEEQLLGYGSVLVLLIGLVLGGIALRRGWLRNPLAIFLALIALAFPVTLAGRFTPLGAELSARSSAFVFVGLAFVTALALVAVFDSKRLSRIGPRTTALRASGPRLAAVGALIVLAGGAALALPSWARVPGPYLVAADPRSVEPIGIDTATWMLNALGPENRLLTDRTNRVLTKAYGLQHPISTVGDQIDVKPAYFAPFLDADNRALLARAKVRYMLIDERMATSLPYVGVYLERGEADGVPWTAPMPAQALDKWNTLPGVDLVYDSGAIRLYDLERMERQSP